MRRDAAEILSLRLLGNSLESFLWAALVFFAALAGLYLLRGLLRRRLQSQSQSLNSFPRFLIRLLDGVKLPEYYLLALYLASRCLEIKPGPNRVIHTLIVVAVTLRAMVLLQQALAYGMGRMMKNAGEQDPEATAAFKNIRLFINAVLWAGALVFILENIGVNISAAVAGLGIGGIAVAMAAQQILGDLFSSFVIYMDKPFSIGDAVEVGDVAGTVEQVGIKTTRIRSVSGEIVVIANHDVTGSRIRNFKQMDKRRVKLNFTVNCPMSAQKALAVTETIREAVLRTKLAQFDRAHFKGFNGQALEFEAAYFVLSSDYKIYMDVQQQVNLEILDHLQKEGILLCPPSA